MRLYSRHTGKVVAKHFYKGRGNCGRRGWKMKMIVIECVVRKRRINKESGLYSSGKSTNSKIFKNFY